MAVIWLELDKELGAYRMILDYIVTRYFNARVAMEVEDLEYKN